MVAGDSFAASVGSLLRRARQIRDLSQQELADRLGTTQSVISRIEAGRSIPTVAFLRRVAAALDVTLVVGFATDTNRDAITRDDAVIEFWPPEANAP